MGKRFSEPQRLRWVQKWQQSGLSVEQFSKGKPFHASTLYNWSRLGQEACEFVPVEILGTDRASVRILYPNGVVIEISETQDIDLIRKLAGC